MISVPVKSQFLATAFYALDYTTSAYAVTLLPMAIPSNRQWTDRARKTRNDRRDESTDLRRDLEELSDSESL